MHEDDAFSFSGSGALSDAAMMSEEEAQAIVQNYNTTICNSVYTIFRTTG